MKARYGWAKLAEVLAEPNAADMIRAYHEELSPLKGLIPVRPDWERKQRLEDEGVYRIWVARVGGTMAGYLSFQIFPHPDYMGVPFAFDAGHYLAPAFRDMQARLGFRMWRTCEIALRKMGVRFVMSHDNVSRPLMPFFVGMNYAPLGGLYMKAL